MRKIFEFTQTEAGCLNLWACVHLLMVRQLWVNGANDKWDFCFQLFFDVWASWLWCGLMQTWTGCSRTRSESICLLSTAQSKQHFAGSTAKWLNNKDCPLVCSHWKCFSHLSYKISTVSYMYMYFYALQTLTIGCKNLFFIM